MLPRACLLACRRFGHRLTRFVLVADVLRQRMTLWEAEWTGLRREAFGVREPAPALGRDRGESAGKPTYSKCSAPSEPVSVFRSGNPPLPAVRAANRRPQLAFNPLCFDSLSSPAYVRRATYVISTSRFGIGQIAGSNCTPLGLHRVRVKAGGGWPIGTAFRDRRAVGFTWRGLPDAPIAHRILWLEGLEPGFNQGGDVDSFARYIYIHGVGDETKLGRPASHGCIHLAARDLIPLYERLPAGALVWISAH